MTPLLRRSSSDDRAFERLYRRHVREVYRYSLAVLGEPADAEDVTQTTFLNAYRAFQRGERPQKPENWLISIAHNVCRQRFRQARRRPYEVEFADELSPAREASEGPSAGDLRRAFAQLPPNQRAALVMRELEGRSNAEIAEVLGISVSALETLLFRARRALREQLEEQLTCGEAELAISRQLDGRLAHDERRMLRAHLRACSECSRLAQSQRAQRKVLRGLLAVPLPPGLTSFFHPAAGTAATTAVAATGTGVAVKAAAVVAGAALVGGGAYTGIEKVPALVKRARPAHVAATSSVAAPAAAGRPGAAADRRRPSRDGAVRGRNGSDRAKQAHEAPHGNSAAARAQAPGQARTAQLRAENRARQAQRRAEKQERAAKARAARERKQALAKQKAKERAARGRPAVARGTDRRGRNEQARAGHGPGRATPPAETEPKAHGRR